MRVIAKQFGVDPGTVHPISCPFDGKEIEAAVNWRDVSAFIMTGVKRAERPPCVWVDQCSGTDPKGAAQDFRA